MAAAGRTKSSAPDARPVRPGPAKGGDPASAAAWQLQDTPPCHSGSADTGGKGPVLRQPRLQHGRKAGGVMGWIWGGGGRLRRIS